MILLENTECVGLEAAVRGMRNPMNSWEQSDSGHCWSMSCGNCANYDCKHVNRDYDNSYQVGKKDYDLMMRLGKAGSVDAKYRRMLVVYVDITAPLYWWKEFDTYKVGTVANSCSTMHKIHAKEFKADDFSTDHLLDFTDICEDKQIDVNDIDQNNITTMAVILGGNDTYWSPTGVLDQTIRMLNRCRDLYLKTKDKRYWWQMIQLLPSSYNQKRTVMLNYEVLAGIYPKRKNHKLDEWHEFCRWIEGLPYSEIITMEH